MNKIQNKVACREIEPSFMKNFAQLLHKFFPPITHHTNPPLLHKINHHQLVILQKKVMFFNQVIILFHQKTFPFSSIISSLNLAYNWHKGH
jgi:hypothetical protein